MFTWNLYIRLATLASLLLWLTVVVAWVVSYHWELEVHHFYYRKPMSARLWTKVNCVLTDGAIVAGINSTEDRGEHPELVNNTGFVISTDDPVGSSMGLHRGFRTPRRALTEGDLIFYAAGRPAFGFFGDMSSLPEGGLIGGWMVPLYAPTLLFTALPAIRLAGWLRQRWRRRAGRCPLCGYDLRESSGGCPECGWNRSPQLGAESVGSGK